tara:strand:- start:46 stop:1518 length:1473 start_codon:yes stop_codon:yes gene_type:complete
MALKKKLIALDESISGNNNDTLVTLDDLGGAVYETPASLTQSYRGYAPHGMSFGMDEDGGKPVTSRMGGTLAECYAFPWLAGPGADGGLNNDEGLDGFLFDTLTDESGYPIIEWVPSTCAAMSWDEGGNFTIGHSAILLDGMAGTPFHSQFDDTKIYPQSDNDDDGTWTQNAAHFWRFNTGKHNTSAAHILPGTGDHGYTAQRIEWTEIPKATHDGSEAFGTMVGQTIHVKGHRGMGAHNGTAPVPVANKQNPKLVGLAVETEYSTHDDSAAIVAKSAKRSFYGKGELYNYGEIKCGAELTWGNSRSDDNYDFMTLGHDGSKGYIRVNSAGTDDKLEFQFKRDNDDPGGTDEDGVANPVTGDAVAVLDKHGNFTVDGDINSWSNSDMRLKDNAKPIDNALDKLKTLSGYTFDWNDNQDVYSGSDIGVMAQEVEEVFPELVAERKSGYKAVKYDKLVPVLIESVKSLSDTIEKLEAKIEKLEASSDRSQSF